MAKIALGAAQFGMDYGISNKRGKIPRQEVFDILNEAQTRGIDTIDTGYMYGDSEAVIGDFVKKYRKQIKIVSKLPGCSKEDEAGAICGISLEKLGIDAFYGYLLHSFPCYKEAPWMWDTLKRLKSENKTKKIGFSLYFPHELEYLFENKVKIDMVQLPYSIFDRRFENYFGDLKTRGIEIHTRSIFLQGLVFKTPEDLDSNFEKLKVKIKALSSLARENEMPIWAVCLGFGLLNKYIDKIVVGVDSMDNFRCISDMAGYARRVEKISDSLLEFSEDDENMILPFRWEKDKPFV